MIILKNVFQLSLIFFLDKEKNNFMIFPEAVWNLSPYKIVLDIFSGAVRAALETNSVVVCSAIERYGKNYIINRDGYLDLNDILKKHTNKTFDEIKNDPQVCIFPVANIRDIGEVVQ